MFFRFIRSIEELAKALNRLADLWEVAQQAEANDYQKQIDDLVAQLKASREPLSASVDKSSQA